MTLRESRLTIPLGAPVREDIADKLLDGSQAVIAARNVVFERQGRIRKAPGWASETGGYDRGDQVVTLRRLNSIISARGNLLLGASGVDSSSKIWADHLWMALERTSETSGGKQLYRKIGHLYPLRQQNQQLSGARTDPQDPDLAVVEVDGETYCWSAWLEDNRIVLSCVDGLGMLRVAPGVLTAAGSVTGVILSRVRILTVGETCHLFAASAAAGSLHFGTFDPTTTESGTVAMANVGQMEHTASRVSPGANLDCTFEAHGDFAESHAGNNIWIDCMGDSDPGAGVEISVSRTADYLASVTIHFEDGVSTVEDVTGAVDALAGDDRVIGIAEYGTPGSTLHAPGDEFSAQLRGAWECWDACATGYGLAEVSLLAFCDATDDSMIRIVSYTEAGAAGPLGPVASVGYADRALAICVARGVIPGGDRKVFLAYDVPEGANDGWICVQSRDLSPALGSYLAETQVFELTTDAIALSNLTICQSQIQESQDSIAGLELWAELIRDISEAPTEYGGEATWQHSVRAWVVNANTGAVKRNVRPVLTGTRLISRALEWDARSHVWVCVESDTYPVAALVAVGGILDEGLPVGSERRRLETISTWWRQTAAWPSAQIYGSGMCALQADSEAMPDTTFRVAAVTRETEGSDLVRLWVGCHDLTGLRAHAYGPSLLIGGAQLQAHEYQGLAPLGFSHPPVLEVLGSTYDADAEDRLRVKTDYTYLAIYEYLDGNGELHQSPPSLMVTHKTAGPTWTDGQTLEITGSNNRISLDFKVWSTGAWNDVGVTVSMPAGDYDSWDELGAALAETINQALADALIGGGFAGGWWGQIYCFKDIPPWDLVQQGKLEEMGDLDPRVFKIICYDPSGFAYILDANWFSDAGSPPASALGTALGYDVTADQVSAFITEERWDEFGATYHTWFPVSWICGSKSLEIEDVNPGVTVSLRVSQHVLGTFERNTRAQCVIYRTEAGSTIFHRVAAVPAYEATEFEQTLSDAMGDDEVATKPSPYTTGAPSDALEHSSPVGWAMCVHRDRLALVSAEYPSRVYMTLPRAAGYAPAFAEACAIDFPEDIAAVGSQGDYLIAYSIGGKVYVVAGAGVDAMGQGSWNPPREISGASGADSHNGVAQAGDVAVHFSGIGGLWAINRGLELRELSKPMHDTITTASVVRDMVWRPDYRRLEIYLTSGSAVWVDFENDRWTVQTGFSNVMAACYHNELTWHVLGSGIGGDLICYQTPAAFLRAAAAFSMSVKTAWIKLGSLAGYQRTWQEIAIGTWHAAHTLRLIRRLNYSTTIAETRDAELPTSRDPYMVRFRPKYQKAAAVQLELQDVPDGVTLLDGPYLEALELVIGKKRGTAKLPLKRA